MTRIVVGGRVASAWGQGGAIWAVANWLLGFEALGHDVTLVEPVDSIEIAALAGTLSATRSALCDMGVAADFLPVRRNGPLGAMTDARAAIGRSDVVFDLSGVLGASGLLGAGRLGEGSHRRVFVDIDPGFTQCWARDGLIDLIPYDAHITVGTRIGTLGCPIPTNGIDWITTVPPVWLAAWASVPPPVSGSWTTVANWRSYGSPQLDGQRLGQKAHAVRQLLKLPELTEQRVIVALDIHPDERSDIEAMATHRWELVDPGVASTPLGFGQFIADSTGEIGIAKEGYVVGATGWISDRTLAYLAAGRPAVVADTGVAPELMSGAGLLVFADAHGAADAIATVESELADHSRAARSWASQHADSMKVCSSLLDTVS